MTDLLGLTMREASDAIRTRVTRPLPGGCLMEANIVVSALPETLSEEQTARYLLIAARA